MTEQENRLTVNYDAENGILYVGKIAYRDTDRLSLISRKSLEESKNPDKASLITTRIRRAEDPLGTGIILSGLKVSKILAKQLQDKYWIRDPWEDLTELTNYTTITVAVPTTSSLGV